MEEKKDKIEIIIDKIKVCFWEHEDFDDIRVREILEQELDKAREEVLLELLEKKTNYKIEEVGHGYKVTQEYVLVSDIEKELSKLSNK